jgi:hypothetical protein
MEQLARQQYAATKDPHDCALAYVALGKRAVLQGLFRSAGNKKARGQGGSWVGAPFQGFGSRRPIAQPADSRPQPSQPRPDTSAAPFP